MNAGYNRGFHVETGKTYRFSVYARRTKDFDQPVKISIESLTGTVFAETEIAVDSAEWKKYTAEMTATGNSTSARLVVLTTGSDTVHLDMISCFQPIPLTIMKTACGPILPR